MKKSVPLTLLATASLSVALGILVCIQFIDTTVAMKIWGYTSIDSLIFMKKRI
jgi:hypothetical protein